MKASKKIFSLVLGTSMFFTGMPECFAMMESAGQDSTRPLSTNAPGEKAPGDSSGPGTPVPLPSGGADAVQPQIVENVAADAETASSEHGSSTSSLADSAAREEESDGETSEGVPEGEPGSDPVSRVPSPDTSSDEGETSDDEREEEDVAPLLPLVAPGIIAEAVYIPAPGTEKSSFFAKTVDVAVVAHPSLSGDVVTNFVSRVWNPTAGKCTVNGTKRKVKFDLIDPYNLNSLKNHRVIISLRNPGFEEWRLAAESFLSYIQPINSRASVIFVSVNSDALATDADANMNPTSGFLPFIVRLFDKVDPNFSSLTPSQITGVKRGGIAAAFVGGALIAMNKYLKSPIQRNRRSNTRKIKNLSKTKSPTSSKHFKKMNAIY